MLGLLAAVGIQAIVIIVDHILAANPDWRSNSTGQLLGNLLENGAGVAIDKLKEISDKKE